MKMFSLRVNLSRNTTLSSHIRNISADAIFYKSHYDVLEVSPSATQGDIKAAYYKKSMIYHPDKNKGSEEAAKSFRDITEAYEVLGNLRLRKLYDKGLLHTVGPEFASPQHEMQHGEEKFYQSREKRSKAPSTGRTNIYNFDAWTQEHYGKSFARREAAKARFDQNIRKSTLQNSDIGHEFLFFASILFMFVFSTFTLMNTITFDEPVDKQDVTSESVETKENVQNR